MSDEQNKSEICSLADDLMNNIDSKPLQTKNKIFLYSRYVLSKLSWYFASENIDSVVKCYLCKWLDIPISGALSTVFLTQNKFGLNIYPLSVTFIQCQTVLCTASNEAVNELWKSISQYKQKHSVRRPQRLSLQTRE